jgi:3-oxoacyl-[acyl-carrier protein] reductase
LSHPNDFGDAAYDGGDTGDGGPFASSSATPQLKVAAAEPDTLKGRVALVTGGGWNIGRAIALRFAEDGATVVIASRNRGNLGETVEYARQRDLNVRSHVADLTRTQCVDDLFRDIYASEGHVDILACIAGGFGAGSALPDTDPREWMDVIARNLFSTYLSCRAALPGMLERKRGDILTCTGGGAFFPMAGVHATAYATAKAGICRFTDQLYSEYMDVPGLRINCIEPGMTLSPIDLERIREEERVTGRPHPARELNHSPDDAAELARFLVSPAARTLNGRILSVDEEWWRDQAAVQQIARSDLYRLRMNYPG